MTIDVARSRRRAVLAGLFLLVAALPLAGSAGARSGGAQAPNAADGGPIVRRDTHHDTSPPLRVLIQRHVRETGSRIGGDPADAGGEPVRSIPRPASPGHEADGALQTERFRPNMPSPNITFDGISNSDNPVMYIPPDTNGEAGLNEYVQMVNVSMAVYDKDTGAVVVAPFDTNAIWNGFGTVCETTNQGDPIVLYDQISDRWLISQFGFAETGGGAPLGPYFECIAVSTTSSAAGAWHRYAFQIDADELNDYPKLGVWPDAYYMSVNEFLQPNFTFSGVKVVAFERDEMLTGGNADMVIFSLGTDKFGLLPSDLDGDTLPPPGSPNYFVEMDANEFGGADQLRVYEFDVNFAGGSTFTGPVGAPAAAFDPNLCNFGDCVPQPGTAVKLDSLAGRLMFRNAYRNFGTHESLVLNHSVDVGADRAGVRWYELRSPNSSPSIFQQGTYAPDTVHRWMASVAMDQDGNLAVGYSASSSSVFPAIRYAGRLAGDPLGQLSQGETVMQAGDGSQTDTAARWGDYTDMTIDPEDDCTFWYTNEYYSSTSERGWKTRIGSFTFPTCGGPGAECPGFEGDPRNHVVGTAAGETLTGTAGADIICAQGGNDVLQGLGGSDLLLGGAGIDTLIGGAGADELNGGDGSDGSNRSTGSGIGVVGLFGNAGNDELIGGAGADDLFGQAGHDTLLAGAGNDYLWGGGGNDTVNGGPAFDYARFEDVTGPVTANISTGSASGTGVGSDDLFQIEGLVGSPAADRLTGNTGSNGLFGFHGGDDIFGLAGNDGLFGGNGFDHLSGGPGFDLCLRQGGGGTVTGCEDTTASRDAPGEPVASEWLPTRRVYLPERR